MKNKNEPSSLSYLGYLTKIKEKEYEIEYLKKQVDLTINNYNSLVDKFNQSQSENKRLKAENEKLEEDIDMLIKEQKYDYRFDIIQAQIDVLNELKERIKTAIDTYFNLDGGGYYLAEDALDDIDELIKEIEK